MQRKYFTHVKEFFLDTYLDKPESGLSQVDVLAFKTKESRLVVLRNETWLHFSFRLVLVASNLLRRREDINTSCSVASLYRPLARA